MLVLLLLLVVVLSGYSFELWSAWQCECGKMFVSCCSVLIWLQGGGCLGVFLERSEKRGITGVIFISFKKLGVFFFFFLAVHLQMRTGQVCIW